MGDAPHPTALAELEAETVGDPKADGGDLPPTPGVIRAEGAVLSPRQEYGGLLMPSYTLLCRRWDFCRAEGRRDRPTYTTISDSKAALRLIQTNGRGLGQRFAIEAIEVSGELIRHNRITPWWTPAHQGIEGNEMANQFLKPATESACDAV